MGFSFTVVPRGREHIICAIIFGSLNLSRPLLGVVLRLREPAWSFRFLSGFHLEIFVRYLSEHG